MKKSKLYRILLELYVDTEFIFLNYIVNHIPCWHIRKFFYMLVGMKIGKNSRVYMGTKVIRPKKIIIGENCIINENCFLDGRGGLKIGNNVSISIFTVIITASHDKNSNEFEYWEHPVTLEDCVWTGARSLILDGSYLEERSVIGAGSVFKGHADSNGIYFGVPARKSGERTLTENYTLDFQPFF